jgi:hypothetical protein
VIVAETGDGVVPATGKLVVKIKAEVSGSATAVVSKDHADNPFPVSKV